MTEMVLYIWWILCCLF